MYLKPTSAAMRVPDPAHQGTPSYFLPATGREVEDNAFWRRRIKDGDVVEATPTAAELALQFGAPAAAPAAAGAVQTPTA